MKNRFTQTVLMTALLLTVIAGCERAPTGMAGQEEAAGSLLEEVPESGSTPMPAMQQLNSSVPSGLSSRAPTPTLAMLSRVKEGMKENEFPGQIGIRQSRSGDNPVYHYHQNTLRFPPGIVRLAEGESTWFKYTYFSSSGEVLIQFQAVVPKTTQAAKMLEKWLRKMTDPEVQKNQVSASGLARPVRSETDDCHQFDPGEQCQTGDFESGFELCETPICGGGSDDEPDDEWPPPPPDDPDWTDPDECDDPTGFDCDDGTGGSSGDGSGGSGDDCDPGAIDQPAGCEEPEPEPCQTGDSNLDNTSFQQQMAATWVTSFGDESNPLPHDQRNEAMILVTAISSGLEFEEIVPDTVSSCRFSAAPGTTIPTNAVALIHTHPYSDGDVINDPRCSAGSYDGTTVSPGDEALMQAISDATSLPPIPMYVIDKDKIRVIQPSNPSQYAQTDNRCGY